MEGQLGFPVVRIEAVQKGNPDGVRLPSLPDGPREEFYTTEPRHKVTAIFQRLMPRPKYIPRNFSIGAKGKNRFRIGGLQWTQREAGCL